MDEETGEPQYPFGMSVPCGGCGATVTMTGYAPAGVVQRRVACSVCGRNETLRVEIVGRGDEHDG